jgi:tetratricopeptide (TPR) repeat protein
LENSVIELNEAIQSKTLLSSTSKEPISASVYNNLGLTYFEKNEMDNAILQFTNAIKPGSSGGGQAVHYNNRGLAYFHEGLKDKALDDFNDAVRLNTQGDPTIYFNRGNVLLALENFQEAISDYKEASKISPSNPKYHHA